MAERGMLLLLALVGWGIVFAIARAERRRRREDGAR